MYLLVYVMSGVSLYREPDARVRDSEAYAV